MKKLNLVLLKPSKYQEDGFVQRFESAFMPNATLSHIASLTPDVVNGHTVDIQIIDEYIRPSLGYLSLLSSSNNVVTLVAIVGVQSHQFHRAIDLAAFARSRGVEHVIVGGPHPMTCDTSLLHGRGVSFSLSEAEVVWNDVLHDATDGKLRALYGAERRWATRIESVEFRPPPREIVERQWAPMVGYYPVRGCPFACNFCSVIKIAGRQVRNPPVDSIVAALKRIKRSGIDLVMFTSDNFNKFPQAPELLNSMVDEKIGIRFFFQSDTQIVQQPDLVDLLARAGALEMFVGVESFNSKTLATVQKRHNKPANYGEIIRLCRDAGIRAHFSNIIGFPDQNEDDIRTHLHVLKDLAPEFASFFILTPIPGTEQYKEFLAKGLIYEKNLDRFDSYTPTFSHASLEPKKLQDLLYESYEDFYKDAMAKHKTRVDRDTRNYMVFSRWSASKRMHPMSFGSGQTFLDKSDDYLSVRRAEFDVGRLLPLPANIELSVADEQQNRKASWTG